MYLCLNCGTVFKTYKDYIQNTYNFCPIAECNNGEVIETDESLVYIIKELYAKGYKTQFCCGGHPHSDIAEATYIIFPVSKYNNVDMNLTRRLILLKRTEYRFIHGILEANKHFYFQRIELRCEIFDYEKLSKLERQKILNQINSDLINWVVDLPNVSKGEQENE